MYGVSKKKKLKLSAQQRRALWKQAPPSQKKSIVSKVFKKLKKGKRKKK